MIRRDSDAGVFDVKFNLPVLQEVSETDFSCLGEFARIVDQIGQNLRDPVSVGQGNRLGKGFIVNQLHLLWRTGQEDIV